MTVALAAEHDRGVAAPGRDHAGRGAHQARAARAPAATPATPSTTATTRRERERLHGGARAALGILLADAARDERRRRRSPAPSPACRPGSACDSVRPTVATASGPRRDDPEDVGHREDRLHHHLEHHRDREQQDCAADRALGEVVVHLAADSVPHDRPDGVPGVRRRACVFCGHVAVGLGSWRSATHRRARSRALEQQLALARVARERRGALELGARLVDAAELGEQVAAHARQQVVALERRLRRSARRRARARPPGRTPSRPRPRGSARRPATATSCGERVVERRDARPVGLLRRCAPARGRRRSRPAARTARARRRAPRRARAPRGRGG